MQWEDYVKKDIVSTYILWVKEVKKIFEGVISYSEYLRVCTFYWFQRNPYSYMKNADLLISSSISEGYPLVSCEALSLGLPILATDCTGNRDVLQNGKYGLLVENTEEGIFRGLKSILDSPQLYENLKEKAYLGFVECQFETRLKQIEHLLEGAEYVQNSIIIIIKNTKNI